jgi:hypothetical protein
VNLPPRHQHDHEDLAHRAVHQVLVRRLQACSVQPTLLAVRQASLRVLQLHHVVEQRPDRLVGSRVDLVHVRLLDHFLELLAVVEGHHEDRAGLHGAQVLQRHLVHAGLVRIERPAAHGVLLGGGRVCAALFVGLGDGDLASRVGHLGEAGLR